MAFTCSASKAALPHRLLSSSGFRFFPFCGWYLGSYKVIFRILYKVISKRNYEAAFGQVEMGISGGLSTNVGDTYPKSNSNSSDRNPIFN